MRISQIREIQSSASDLNQNIARYDRFRNLEMSGDDKFLSNQIRMSSSWVRSSGDKSPESRSSWAVIKSPFCWCESTSICVTTKRRYIPRPHFQPWNHPRVERAAQYGERKRPEFLSIDLMIDAQVAHAISYPTSLCAGGAADISRWWSASVTTGNAATGARALEEIA